jgi:ABC-type bacteriocin/lantibiotic exporter with double-glycine peptidase domain
MKNYGCAVAALAMVFKYHNEDITPGKLAKQPLFSFDLIKWPATWRSISLVANEARQKVNWTKVDENIKNGYPVIVFVRAVGKSGGHYVVVFAKDSRGYIVNDPMWGSNIYLNSTRENIGTLYETTTSVEQMILYK